MEFYWWNSHPLMATTPYHPLSLGDAAPAGCPERPWWWLAAAAAAGGLAAFAYEQNKGKGRRRAR